jgi:hypothetical protein
LTRQYARESSLSDLYFILAGSAMPAIFINRPRRGNTLTQRVPPRRGMARHRESRLPAQEDANTSEGRRQIYMAFTELSR